MIEPDRGDRSCARSGRRLLAGAGALLIAAGLVLLSIGGALVIASGMAVLGLATRLIVLAAFYESAAGHMSRRGLEFEFGSCADTPVARDLRPSTSEVTADDRQPSLHGAASPSPPIETARSQPVADT
jgi:hypothetical protein